MNIKERNHVHIIGDGPQTIVMAHGFGCDQKMWRYLYPYFSQYKIVLFDYVGSGNADKRYYQSSKYKSLHGYKEDLIEVLEDLQLENIIYIGHSVSSMIGLLAANEKPNLFRHLIMIGPSPRYLNDVDYYGGFDRTDIEELLAMMEMNFLGWASFMAPYALGEKQSNSYTSVLEETFKLNDPQVAKEFAEVTFYSDHRADLQKCTTPAFIIQCSNDSIVPIEVGKYLDANIPKSELIIVDSKGHYPHITVPTLISDIIHKYLEENEYA